VHAWQGFPSHLRCMSNAQSLARILLLNAEQKQSSIHCLLRGCKLPARVHNKRRGMWYREATQWHFQRLEGHKGWTCSVVSPFRHQLPRRRCHRPHLLPGVPSFPQHLLVPPSHPPHQCSGPSPSRRPHLQ
jgi:hypothetical protein